MIKKEKGQATLLVLLIVAIALVLGLSILSQSTTDLRISKQGDSSTRAFNAAEAGIEKALKNLGAGGDNITVDGIAVSYNVAEESVLNKELKENEIAQIDLEGVNSGLSEITINWIDTSKNENPGSCLNSSGGAPASLLITVIEDNYDIRRYGINSCSLHSINGLEDVADSGSGVYLRKYTFVATDSDNLIRIRAIYNKTSLSVAGNVDLPIQMHIIDSFAQTETKESKKVKVTRTQPAVPAIFDYVLFSGTNIVKSL